MNKRNLLLTEDNIVKICDFGISKNLKGTLARTFSGTPLYMSPEQSKGRYFDEQIEYSTYNANTDIWYDLI